MRAAFHGFFQPNKDEYDVLWKDAAVVLDTNALLNLYRYTTKSRNELLQALEGLAGRLWLPHRVGVEFHKRRLGLIREQHYFAIRSVGR